MRAVAGSAGAKLGPGIAPSRGGAGDASTAGALRHELKSSADHGMKVGAAGRRLRKKSYGPAGLWFRRSARPAAASDARNAQEKRRVQAYSAPFTARRAAR
jgi:hypothetical protein